MELDWRKEVDRAAWTPSIQSMSVTFAGRLWRMGGFVVQGESSSSDWRNMVVGGWSHLDPRYSGSCLETARRWSTSCAQWKAMVAGRDADIPGMKATSRPSTMSGQPKTVSTGRRQRPRLHGSRARFTRPSLHNGRLWVMGGGHWGKNPMLYRDVWSSFGWDQMDRTFEQGCVARPHLGNCCILRRTALDYGRLHRPAPRRRQ